ncbi:hypothetical protein [Methylocella sp.]|uniref:hypothetical protein n=1 Tax=Methylocella sp. TaxID=1978226 RepID=UPI003C181BA3
MPLVKLTKQAHNIRPGFGMRRADLQQAALQLSEYRAVQNLSVVLNVDCRRRELRDFAGDAPDRGQDLDHAAGEAVAFIGLPAWADLSSAFISIERVMFK